MDVRTLQPWRAFAWIALALVLAQPVLAQPRPPELTQPVNDFAGVIDADSSTRLDRLIRALFKASGDTVVVATIKTFKPWGDLRSYATAMFENHGRGIGAKGKDNGLLVLLAVDDRQVWVEVGYDLEGAITDGFAGETSRQVMAPRFRDGQYGAGLLEGTTRIIGRIAEARNVTVDGVAAPAVTRPSRDVSLLDMAALAFVVLIILLSLRSRGGSGPRRRWRGGVGPWGGPYVGGPWGGGSWGGGSTWRGTGGFGGFGGGRSGGGGGGASW